MFITKTCLYNFDLLTPHFYIVKLRFTRVYIIFLISAQKHSLWVLVRTAVAVLTSTTIYVLSRIIKISDFLSETFHSLVVEFSVYLNRYVLVMLWFLHTLQKTRLFKYINILKISPLKNWKFSDNISDIFFLYFCSQHTLWVLVTTASPRRF